MIRRNFCYSKPLSPEDRSVTAASVTLIKDVRSDDKKNKEETPFLFKLSNGDFYFF